MKNKKHTSNRGSKKQPLNKLLFKKSWLPKNAEYVKDRSQCIYVHAFYKAQSNIANYIAIYSSKNFFLPLQDW